MLAVIRGHAEVVRVLVGAGAAVELQGTGAPGFAGRTAHDLAAARGDAAQPGAASAAGAAHPRDAARSGAAVPVAGDLERSRRAGRLHAADSRRHPRPPAARLAGARSRSPPPRSAPSPPDPRGALRRRRGVAGAARRLHRQAARAGGALRPGAVPHRRAWARRPGVSARPRGAARRHRRAQRCRGHLGRRADVLLRAEHAARGRRRGAGGRVALPPIRSSDSVRRSVARRITARSRPCRARTPGPAVPARARSVRPRSPPCDTTRRVPARRPCGAAAPAGRCG